MPTTAKVRCNSKTESNEQVMYAFAADYLSEDGKAINAEWARYTPAISVTITVKPEVEFTLGRAYTLTFEPAPVD